MIQQGKALKINLEMVPSVQCGAAIDDGAKCVCVKFVKSFQIKRISALMSGTGKDEFVQLEYMHCASCGQVKVLR
jgi:hypothetical protein